MPIATRPKSTVPLTEKITCQLEVLTPVHVGSGEVLQENADYFIQDKVWIVDKEKLFECLLTLPERNGKTGFDVYADYLAKGNHRALEKYLRGEGVNWEEIAKYDYDYPKGDPAKEIRAITRTGMGQAILPGSSIKGAIKSVLFNYLYQRNNIRHFDKKIDDHLLGSFERSVMRFIRPYDVEIDKTNLVNVHLYNLYSRGFDWESTFKRDFLITLESFPKAAKGQFRIAIDNGFVQRIRQFYKEVLHRSTSHIIKEQQPFQFLFKLINGYTRLHINRELAFFERYPEAEGTDEMISMLNTLKTETINKPHSCILRLSYGSGFHAITGDWLYRDHTDTGTWDRGRHQGKIKYKSRKFADDGIFNPLGFIRLTLPEGIPDIPVKSNTAAISRKQVDQVADSPAIYVPKVTVQELDYGQLKPDAILSAEVLKVGKPFSTVKLLITNYPFDLEVQMSGVKKAKIKIGQIVRVLVNSRSKEGVIKTVKFIH